MKEQDVVDLLKSIEEMAFDLLPPSPNAETIAAIHEVEEVKSGRISKRTMSVADFAKEMGD